MSPRLNYHELSPSAVQTLWAVEQYVRSSTLEGSLLELVKLRASYLNGCAYCVDMHSQDARAEGETEQRLYALPVWRETPFYSARERAALAWTEAVTQLSQHGVSEQLYEETRQHFSERELVDLTMAVIAINSWNRVAVSFAQPPGSYRRASAPDASRE